VGYLAIVGVFLWMLGFASDNIVLVTLGYLGVILFVTWCFLIASSNPELNTKWVVLLFGLGIGFFGLLNWIGAADTVNRSALVRASVNVFAASHLVWTVMFLLPFLFSLNKKPASS